MDPDLAHEIKRRDALFHVALAQAVVAPHHYRLVLLIWTSSDRGDTWSSLPLREIAIATGVRSARAVLNELVEAGVLLARGAPDRARQFKVNPDPREWGVWWTIEEPVLAPW